MSRPSILSEARAFRLGTGMIGAALMASAVLATDLAREHIRLLGEVCGPRSDPHCGWCYAAASLFLGGLAAFAIASTPIRAPVVIPHA